MNMPVDTFLTALYTLVDDWYQAYAPTLLQGKVGRKPVFSDSEVLTLALAQHWLGFAHERPWLRFLAQNYPALFPRLLSQPEFNRRARRLAGLLNQFRRHLVRQLGADQAEYQLIDGTPISVRHWRRAGRDGRHRSYLPGAALGQCRAKRLVYYGYQLVALTTLDGILTDWELIPADADEREAAQDLLEHQWGRCILGDKGYLGERWQTEAAARRGHAIWTPKRRNQRRTTAKAWERQLLRLRRRIETTLAQAKEWFGLERPRARTFSGLGSRLVAKLTGLTVAAWVNRQHGRSPLILASFSF